MTEHYDVIIIGSGAGGGTLAHTLAGSGKQILLLERGNYLPREMDNWDPEPVFIHGKYISKDTWYDADGKPFQPQVHYNVGGATKLYGAALYRLRPQDFGEIRHVDGLSPAWPLDLRRLRAVVHARPSGSTRCTATPARTRPRATGRSRTRGRRCRTSRGSSSSPTSSTAGGYHPFHAPCGILLDEADRARSTCIRCTWCDGYPCLVHAKADAETIAVRPLLDRPNVTLLVDAEVTRLETDADRAHRHRRRRVPRRRRRRCTRATSSSCRPGRPTRPSCCCARPTTTTPTAWPTARTRSGRNYMFHNCKAIVALAKEPNDTVFQKTVGLNDFYFGAPGLRLAGRQHPDDRQVQRRGDEGRGAEADQAGAPLLAGRGGPARPRLLADHRGPAPSRTTGSPSTATATSTSPTGRPTTRRPTASTTS